jgi:hypothetical protein
MGTLNNIYVLHQQTIDKSYQMTTENYQSNSHMKKDSNNNIMAVAGLKSSIINQFDDMAKGSFKDKLVLSQKPKI